MQDVQTGYRGSYSNVVYQYLNRAYPHSITTYSNGAKGACGSNYFAPCLHKHLDEKADLILLDFAVNGARIDEVEQIVRKILHPHGGMGDAAPAIVFVNYWNYWPGRDDEVGQMYNKRTGGRWLPANWTHGAPLEDNESNIDVVASYYDIPSLSLRTAIMYENINNASGFGWHDIDCGGNHPNARGHHMLADMVVNLLERARHEIIRRAGVGTPSFPNWLPPSLVANNEAERWASSCEMGKPELLSAANAQWVLLYWSDPKPGLWGNVTDGSTRLQVNLPRTTMSGGLNLSWDGQRDAMMHVFYLRSWEPVMGSARVSCISTCSCEPQDINARGGEATIEVPHSFRVSLTSNHCILGVVNLGGSFKLFGAAFENRRSDQVEIAKRF